MSTHERSLDREVDLSPNEQLSAKIQYDSTYLPISFHIILHEKSNVKSN